jgi:predicted amidohydrolase YtcJ
MINTLVLPLTAAEKADLILYNGKVITVDPKDRIVQAVAVKDGKILQAGENSEIRALAGPQCRMIDLKGRTVTPGLIDSHYHVAYYGRQFWPGHLNIRIPEVTNKADLLRVVGQEAKRIKKGEWISGNQGFHIESDAALDRRDLDRVAPDNPVYLRHGSGQYAVVNSLALKIAGIDRNTPDPPSSKIWRDSRGDPTGVLSHYPAENLVAKYATGYGDRTEEQLLEDIERGQELCLQAGYTFAQDVIVGSWNDIQMYQKFAESGRLKLRLYLMLYVNTEEQARIYCERIKPFKSDRLTFGGWKLAIDGGLAAGTALMYDKSLYASKNSYPYHTQEQLNRIVKMLHDTDLQIAVHVAGDQGIDMTLTAFEEAMKANPRKNPRHRIEHGLFPTRSALERIKKSGVILSTQPQWILWHGDGFITATNEKIMKQFLPLKTILDMDIPLAFGCDVPATIYQEPRYAFSGACARRTRERVILNPEERLTLPEAVRVHTMGSAYAAFAEEKTGSLEPGKWADLTVWSHDVYSPKPEMFRNLKAVMTIVNGEIVYDGISAEK